MTHIGLFEGIGGFSLAARWMGWETVGWCEINPFGQQVLKYYYPEAEAFTDIKQSDFTKYANRIDVLTGGFPCQPYSQAGKRLGKEDERHLWPEMLRAIREIQPRWVVGENVRGLTNWNGGMVFDEVQADLELAGYEVLPFLLPACAKDAPHRRDRIWFIANSKRFRSNGKRDQDIQLGKLSDYEFGIQGFEQFTPDTTGNGEHRAPEPENSNRQSREWRGRDIDHTSEVSRQNVGANATNSDSGFSCEIGRDNEEDSAKEIGNMRANNDATLFGRAFNPNISTWDNFPTQPPLCSRNDGLYPELSGITFSKHRNESIKAYGNAIVPQVAFEIFKAIEAYQNLKTAAV